jgi:hypothetical protein
MTTTDLPPALRTAVAELADATRHYRELAETHSRLRVALDESAARLHAAQAVRDAAVRRARADGLTFRELAAATGYSRGWLDRIVAGRTDRQARRR